MPYELVRIIGVITEEVGSPRNDGTPGSALYRVPIRLSRDLTSEEARHLEYLWDRPPSFTRMHRPGIAQISGDVLTLDGTTVDEVASYHAATLVGILERFNLDAAESFERAEAVERAREQAAVAHREHVEGVAGPIRFDG